MGRSSRAETSLAWVASSLSPAGRAGGPSHEAGSHDGDLEQPSPPSPFPSRAHDGAWRDQPARLYDPLVRGFAVRVVWGGGRLTRSTYDSLGRPTVMASLLLLLSNSCSSVSGKCAFRPTADAQIPRADCPIASADYPQNILVDEPQDPSSRWAGHYQPAAATSSATAASSGASAASSSTSTTGGWIVLELKKPALLRQVHFGKFHRRTSDPSLRRSLYLHGGRRRAPLSAPFFCSILTSAPYTLDLSCRAPLHAQRLCSPCRLDARDAQARFPGRTSGRSQSGAR